MSGVHKRTQGSLYVAFNPPSEPKTIFEKIDISKRGDYLKKFPEI